MIDDFKQCIQESQRILITSHLGPDADSLCSDILLASTIKFNFPSKDVAICNEDKIKPLSFIDGYDGIEFNPLQESINKHQPDLLIMLDVDNIARCSREPEIIKKYLEEHGTKVVIIDHHQEVDRDKADIYINNASPACTQDIYEICFEHLNLKKPEGYAPTAMLGIYADTGGFVYDNLRYKDTHRIVAQLIEDGASVETIAHRLSTYSEESLEVLSELIKNLNNEGNCTFSFVSDEFVSRWLEQGKPVEAIKEGFDIYLHHIMRNIEDRPWGFGIYPDVKEPDKTYKISFRSTSGVVDVSVIARKLGGGGHKPAAGAIIKARSASEALEQVKQAIAGAQA